MTNPTQPPMPPILELLMGGGGLNPMSILNEMMRGTKVEVNRSKETKQIILPDTMSLLEAKKWIERRIREEEKEVAIHEEVDAFPFDAAYALHRAMSDTYGWTDMVPTPGFFGDTPPRMVGVEIDNGKTVQVGWGRIQIPNVDGYIQTQFTLKDGGRPILLIGGVVKQKHKAEVSELAALTRKYIKDSSIYRGRAVQIDFDYDPENFDPTRCPTFMELGDVNVNELIFPEKTQREIETSLFAPIEHSQLLRDLKVPLKRGVLMYGPYGVGKTLSANIAAKKCEQNKWTFVYLRDAAQIPAAIEFAHQYQPCVVFAEDIDQILSGKRTQDMNSVLNVIDGIDSKGSEIMVVLTTNNIEEIHQAALRPGRLDAVIHITAPDAIAVQALVRNYARGRLGNGEDLTKLGTMLDGQIPAVIREVVERSKITAATRVIAEKGDAVTADDVVITAEDLEFSAESLNNQIELLIPKATDKRNELEKAAEAFGGRVGEHLQAVLAGNGNGNGAEKK